MTKGKYIIGMCDYDKPGFHRNQADVEWELTDDGCFSASGHIWNGRHTDILAGGQMIDVLVKLFPNDKKLKRIHSIWERWHLNDMRAGSPNQEMFLRHYPDVHDYTARCELLSVAMLQPDNEYIHNGKPYRYGSAWLKEELPKEVIEEILSW